VGSTLPKADRSPNRPVVSDASATASASASASASRQPRGVFGGVVVHGSVAIRCYPSHYSLLLPPKVGNPLLVSPPKHASREIRSIWPGTFVRGVEQQERPWRAWGTATLAVSLSKTQSFSSARNSKTIRYKTRYCTVIPRLRTRCCTLQCKQRVHGGEDTTPPGPAPVMFKIVSTHGQYLFLDCDTEYSTRFSPIRHSV